MNPAHKAVLKDAAREAARLQVVDAPEPEEEESVPIFATLAELMERPELLQPPECVVPFLAYRGRLVILAGPDKSGKSTLLGHAIAAVTGWERFLGSPLMLRHRRAVLLGLEEAVGDAVRRLVELEADPDGVQLVVMPQPDLLHRTHSLLEEWPADLLVIDSLQEYARVTLGQVPEDGDNAGWGTAVRPLAALARKHDVAVVLLHHVRRSDGQYRGAGEIAATADALLEMSMPKTDDSPNLRRISGRGRWAVEPFAVELCGNRYELTGGEKLSLDARVLLFVERNPGASMRAVRDGVEGQGKRVDGAVKTLLDRGAIVNRGTVGMALHAAADTPTLEGL